MTEVVQGCRTGLNSDALPKTGELFPTIKLISANHRAAEFRRRCRVAGIQAISLHSYRHSWAQRAKACGYPQRFAQEALGHSSSAVHEAYAKGATVICPALDEYETLNEQKIVPLPLRAGWLEKSFSTAQKM